MRLTEERWAHIIGRHPEMAPEQERLLEVISDPELIQQGDFGALTALRHYEHTTLTSKFVAVVYRETSRSDGFILTAYLASESSSSREIRWKR